MDLNDYGPVDQLYYSQQPKNKINGWLLAGIACIASIGFVLLLIANKKEKKEE